MDTIKNVPSLVAPEPQIVHTDLKKFQRIQTVVFFGRLKNEKVYPVNCH